MEGNLGQALVVAKGGEQNSMGISTICEDLDDFDTIGADFRRVLEHFNGIAHFQERTDNARGNSEFPSLRMEGHFGNF